MDIDTPPPPPPAFDDIWYRFWYNIHAGKSIQEKNCLLDLQIAFKNKWIRSKTVNLDIKTAWQSAVECQNKSIEEIERFCHECRYDCRPMIVFIHQCRLGNLAVVERLLEKSYIDPAGFGNMPIRFAKDTKVARLLLRNKNVDPSVDNCDLLRRAYMRKQFALVYDLLQDERVLKQMDLLS